MSFRGRRSGGLRRALERARDPELGGLEDALSERRGRVAELELELFELRSELAEFEAQLNRRLGPLEARRNQLREQLRAARMQAARRAQWGDRADSDDIPEDVIEQFRKTWRRSGTVPRTRKPTKISAQEEQEIKRIYRALAKRFHPDLTTDPQEKARREEIMAQVNQAYSDKNLAKLRTLQSKPDAHARADQQTREKKLADMRAEVRRLDGVILNLETTLRNLTNSRLVQLKLEASFARSQGKDLMRDMEDDIRREIAELQVELASIQ